MRISRRTSILAGLVILATVGGAVSCADRVVYRDRLDFAAPPANAAGFLGYQNEAAKATVCGNCHVGHAQTWKRTAHAGAWKTLQESGHAQTVCEACHTVNENGNATVDQGGGWVDTKDPRYHDVQCENCHGAGLTHVENPDATQPLAPISVGTNLTIGCGECHSGVHHPFVEEWESSKHATPEPHVLESATPSACIGCHTAQGALAAWGVQADYLEKGAPVAQHNGIVCAVCHDPHSNAASRDSTYAANNPGPISMPNSGGQLRYPADVPDQERNLCIRCHHKRSQPDIDPATQSSRGPHSPEGPLLLGEDVGWWFGGTPYDNQRIVGTHGTERNPRLCATCHMVRYDVTDPNGVFITSVVGHRFAATPCVDANGAPTGGDDCAKTVNARSYKGCATSGCHTEASAASLDTVVFTRIMNLAANLKALVDQVRATEVKANDGVWTTAEGADFNYQLAIKKGSHVHNPFLVEALLTSSIQHMRDEYGLAVSANVELRNIIGTPAMMRWAAGRMGVSGH
jgi:hypothetical protein